MLICKYWTKDYKHDYFFKFKGNEYRVHSIVRLTEEGKRYLGALSDEVILTECFINWNGKRCWKYEFKSVEPPFSLVNYSTDKSPNKLIKEIVIPATADYASREILGANSPVYATGIKHTKKDLEIPELRVAWLVYILVFIGAMIFKDWYVKIIIWFAAGWLLSIYRKYYIDAYTTYTHDEDSKILKKKYEIIYGIKHFKEDNTNE